MRDICSTGFLFSNTLNLGCWSGSGSVNLGVPHIFCITMSFAACRNRRSASRCEIAVLFTWTSKTKHHTTSVVGPTTWNNLIRSFSWRLRINFLQASQNLSLLLKMGCKHLWVGDLGGALHNLSQRKNWNEWKHFYMTISHQLVSSAQSHLHTHSFQQMQSYFKTEASQGLLNITQNKRKITWQLKEKRKK